MNDLNVMDSLIEKEGRKKDSHIRSDCINKTHTKRRNERDIASVVFPLLSVENRTVVVLLVERVNLLVVEKHTTMLMTTLGSILKK